MGWCELDVEQRKKISAFEVKVGYYRYAGNRSQTGYFSIVTRPVRVGEIFELTWEDANDRHHYKITKVVRLNVNAETPEDEAHMDAPVHCESAAGAEQRPGIFIKVGGRIDNDEFVCDGGKLRFRIDGDKVYELVGATNLIGFIQPDRTITAPRVQALYRIEAE